MTYKRLRILQTALELFAKEGFHATSTNKVAKQAGVSEGLVFKHFGNKAGLLEAILKEGEKRLLGIYASIISEEDPKLALRNTILMPFQIKVTEYDFWKLQFKLKWELNISGNEKMAPLVEKLVSVFTQLQYDQPEMEAETLVLLLDGFAGALLKNSIVDKIRFKEFLLTKYKV